MRPEKGEKHTGQVPTSYGRLRDGVRGSSGNQWMLAEDEKMGCIEEIKMGTSILECMLRLDIKNGCGPYQC